MVKLLEVAVIAAIVIFTLIIGICMGIGVGYIVFNNDTAGTTTPVSTSPVVNTIVGKWVDSASWIIRIYDDGTYTYQNPGQSVHGTGLWQDSGSGRYLLHTITENGNRKVSAVKEYVLSGSRLTCIGNTGYYLEKLSDYT